MYNCYSSRSINNLVTLNVSRNYLSSNMIKKLSKLKVRVIYHLQKHYRYSATIDILAPILSGKSFPNLLFLAIRGTANTSEIAQAIAKSSILNKLRVLELTDGNLTNIGAITLLKTPAINRLHTLDVSGNRINPGMLEQLSQLKCRVLTDSQFNDRYYSIWE